MKQLSAQEEQIICEDVMRHITQRRLGKIRMRASLYGFFLITAVLIMIPAFGYVAERAQASGFTEYVSLIASDGASLSGAWGALMMSLAESVPVEGIALTLAALALAGFCARKFAVSRHFLYRTII